MSSHHPPFWQRLLWGVIAAVVVLEVLADVLPRLMVPIAILAVIFVTVRVVLFYTNRL